MFSSVAEYGMVVARALYMLNTFGSGIASGVAGAVIVPVTVPCLVTAKAATSPSTVPALSRAALVCMQLPVRVKILLFSVSLMSSLAVMQVRSASNGPVSIFSSRLTL